MELESEPGCTVLLDSAVAQSPIRFVKASKIFILDAGKSLTSLASISRACCSTSIGAGMWGVKKIRNPSTKEWSAFDLSTTTTPQEYQGGVPGCMWEPSLKVTFPDGNRDLVLHYMAHQIAGNTLTVTLKDIERALLVQLHYTVYPQTACCAEVTIENRTDKAVVLESAQSAAWFFRRGWLRCAT